MYRNSIQGSAICAFNLSAINAAFSGPFKYQETPSSIWEHKELQFKHQFECKFNPTSSLRHDILNSAHRFQLMNDAVQPITIHPLYTSHEKLIHITVDFIPTKFHNKVQIVFVSTAENLIKKLSILPHTKETCVVEIWESDLGQNYKILTLQFIKQAESIYMGTKNSIIRIPVQHCSRHESRKNCLQAMDPYCGWNDLKQKVII